MYKCIICSQNNRKVVLLHEHTLRDVYIIRLLRYCILRRACFCIPVALYCGTCNPKLDIAKDTPFAKI